MPVWWEDSGREGWVQAGMVLEATLRRPILKATGNACALVCFMGVMGSLTL